MSTYRGEDLPAEIAASIRVNPATGCWKWTGRTNRKGYGRITWQGREQEAHRVVYALLENPIPEGLTLDHVEARGCASKACCWPVHLEPVTRGENSRRNADGRRKAGPAQPYRDCSCRDSSGRLLGTRCPQLGQKGHGAWYARYEAPRGADGRRRRPAARPVHHQAGSR